MNKTNKMSAPSSEYCPSADIRNGIPSHNTTTSNQENTSPINSIHVIKNNSEKMVASESVASNDDSGEAARHKMKEPVDTLKYTIANSGFASPMRFDGHDNEIMSILQRDSPRSLIEHRDLEHGSEHSRAGSTSSHTGSNTSSNTSSNTGQTRLDQVKTNLEHDKKKATTSNRFLQDPITDIHPPPQIRRNRDDEILHALAVDLDEDEDVNKGQNEQQSHSPPKNIQCSHLQIKNDDEVEEHPSPANPSTNGFPDNPFPQSRQRWNPIKSGLFPSSYDTIGSGYGSLDYSSEDQSLDTHPRRLKRSLTDGKHAHKPHNMIHSIRKGRHHKSRSLSTGDNPEHLPLVPEVPLIRSEEYMDESGDQSFTGNNTTPQEPKLVEKRGSRRKNHSRQIVIASLIDDVRGFKQPTSCRDFIFTLLFYAQAAFILFLGIAYGPQALGYVGTGNDITIETGVVLFTYRNVIILTLGCGIISIAISSMLLLLMTTAAKSVVQIALFVTMSLALMWTLIGLLFSPQTFVPVMGLVSFGVSVAYTFTVWDRIPFVTAQLNTALSAIRDVSSIIFLACAMQIIALIVIIFYLFTCIGIYDYFQVDNHLLSQNWKHSCFIGLGISFIWTFQVVSVRNMFEIKYYCNNYTKNGTYLTYVNIVIQLSSIS